MAGVGASLLALACTPFTGAVSHDAGSIIVDAADADVAVDRPPPDVPHGDATGPRVCGLDRGICDPVSDLGCPAGQTCVVTSFSRLDAECSAPGTVRPFAVCEAEGDCVAGVHCVDGRCLPLCCTAGGDGVCADRIGAASRCVVLTQSGLLAACTLPGNCEYPSNRGCAAGFQCEPTSLLGEPMCVPFGAAAVGAQCAGQGDCVEGATCLIPIGRAGTCQPMCDPSAGNTCGPGGQCLGFADRPHDWGFCAR